MNTEKEYVLEMKDITKHYGENTVLNGVSLSVKKGEIHALLGENGAGKSTLMNILFGMPVIHSTGGFEGKVLLDGEETHLLMTPWKRALVWSTRNLCFFRDLLLRKTSN